MEVLRKENDLVGFERISRWHEMHTEFPALGKMGLAMIDHWGGLGRSEARYERMNLYSTAERTNEASGDQHWTPPQE